MNKLLGILVILSTVVISGQYPPPPRNLSVYFVDPDYSGSTRNGTRDHPWQSLSDTLTNNPWTVINTALVKGQTTVYFSARKASSNTNQTTTVGIVINRTGTNALILDGHTKYNTNISNPQWIDYSGIANFQTPTVSVTGIQSNITINRITLTTNYYVRTDGSNSNAGTSNTSGGAWRTIDYAADNSPSGAIIYVQPGTYSEIITPGVSGILTLPQTFVANGAVTFCGMSISSKNYIRVVGFTIDSQASGCTPNSNLVIISGTNTGLEFWNNLLQNTNNNAFLVNANDRCNSCILVGNTIQNIGLSTISYNALTLTGDDNFVGYGDFNTICYLGVVPSGHRLRFINLNFSGMIQCGASHPDFYYIQGTNSLGYSNNLIESNYGIGTITASDNKVFHAQTQTTPPVNWIDNIFRNNVIYNMGAGYYSAYSDSTYGLITRWRFYNDTVVNMVQAQNQSDPQFDAGGNLSSQFGPLSASLYNNIYVNGWTNAARTMTTVDGWSAQYAGSTITHDYNLLYDTRGSLTKRYAEAHPQTNVNPLFVNSGTNFTLQSGSGARGTGGPLTLAVGSGNSSKTLTVTTGTGSLFIGSNSTNLPQYNGVLVPGDLIKIGTAPARITSISGDVLTLETATSWSNGASIYLGSSTVIDIGAYPYKATGYSLSATYSIVSSTATVTPNDSSLVRFVVCYNDGVPFIIDNSSPYTCPVSSGTFSAQVYPRYASTTRWAVATP